MNRCRHLRSLLLQFFMFSRTEAPVGRRLTVVPGDVKTRIRLITRRLSLVPTSRARTPMGSPYGALSLASEGGIQGFHVSLLKYAGLGACCRLAITRLVARQKFPRQKQRIPFARGMLA